MRRFSISLAFLAAITISACGNSNTDTRNAGKQSLAQKKAERMAKRLDTIEVARVGSTSIYQRDVEQLAIERGLLSDGATLDQSDPQYQTLLESLIDQRLLAQAAVKRALDQTDDNKRRLSMARERILSNALLEAYLKAEVNETTIRRLYEEQSALADRGDEIRVRHIVLSDEASAKAALKALEGGEPFADLAHSVSLDIASREKGGDLGYMTYDMPPPDFAAIVFAAEPGSKTDIFRTEMGWHIAEILDRRPSQKQSFETVRPNIVKFLTFEAIEDLLVTLRRETEIETFYKQPIMNEAEEVDNEIDPSDSVVED